jgi:hypothetical protein
MEYPPYKPLASPLDEWKKETIENLTWYIAFFERFICNLTDDDQSNQCNSQLEKIKKILFIKKQQKKKNNKTTFRLLEKYIDDENSLW